MQIKSKMYSKIIILLLLTILISDCSTQTKSDMNDSADAQSINMLDRYNLPPRQLAKVIQQEYESDFINVYILIKTDGNAHRAILQDESGNNLEWNSSSIRQITVSYTHLTLPTTPYV